VIGPEFHKALAFLGLREVDSGFLRHLIKEHGVGVACRWILDLRQALPCRGTQLEQSGTEELLDSVVAVVAPKWGTRSTYQPMLGHIPAREIHAELAPGHHHHLLSRLQLSRRSRTPHDPRTARGPVEITYV
jgi:hypothetical protein